MEVTYHIVQGLKVYSSTKFYDAGKAASDFYLTDPQKPLTWTITCRSMVRYEDYVFFDSQIDNILHCHYLGQTEIITNLEELIAFSDKLAFAMYLMSLSGLVKYHNSGSTSQMHLFFEDTGSPLMNPFYRETTIEDIVSWQKEGF